MGKVRTTDVVNEKAWWLIGSLLLSVIVGLSGCAGFVGTPPTNPGNPTVSSVGNVAAFLTDAPADGVTAFSVEVTGATLVGPNGTLTNVSTTTQRIEVTHLQLAPTLVFQASALPSGNYTALNLTFANPQITLVDSQGNVTVLSATTSPSVQLATTTLNQPMNMTLQASGAAGLIIDLDLGQSIQTDTNGNYVITPVANISNATNSTTEPSLEDASAIVTSISSTSAVTVQLQDTGQVITVGTNPSTVMAADAGQSTSGGLQIGEDIQFAAQFQTDGSFLADQINTVSPNPLLCFGGVVSGVNQDGAGNTSLDVIVQN